ncbi:unnamed protein product [Trichobilharzia regenti]|nr:unnamed protein product [Trichobilharzia regenti]
MRPTHLLSTSTVLIFLSALILETKVNTSEIYTNITKVSSNTTGQQTGTRLLQGDYSSLLCLRLYSEINLRGSWYDMCDSNEAISRKQAWNTRSACSPEMVWRPEFYGRYLLLSPGQCIYNIPQYGLKRVSSIVKCTQASVNNPSLQCLYPPLPWNQHFPVSPSAAQQLSSRQLPNSSFPEPLRLRSQPSPLSLTNLTVLQEGSVNSNNTGV